MRRSIVVAFFVLFACSLNGQSQETSPPLDIASLRAQIDALKAEYEKRINDLQKQLDEVQNKISEPSSPQPPDPGLEGDVSKPPPPRQEPLATQAPAGV